VDDVGQFLHGLRVQPRLLRGAGTGQREEGRHLLRLGPDTGDSPNAVPAEQRVEILHKAEDVRAKRFGGEGTGGQSFFGYDWKPGQAYRLLVRATAEDRKTAYTAYFYLPETEAWKHLIIFRTTTGGDPLRGTHSFVEDFCRDGKSAGEARRASFGGGWVLDTKGQWHPLNKARFTASAAAREAKETIDAGLTGGDTKTTTPLNTVMERPVGAAVRDTKPPRLPEE
jgi:hypothetical protein